MSDFETARRYPNVTFGGDAEIGDFVVLGHPPVGMRPGELPTKIGKGAVIRSHTVIYAGSVIGDEFQTGHGVLLRERNTIGNRVSVGSHSIIEFLVHIGDDVRIHSNAFIPEHCVLEEGAWIGPGVVLTNARYPRSRTVKQDLQGVHVGRGAKLGAAVVVLPGVRIGANALVGAGAVVVHDVPENTVVAGNPARVIRSIDQISEYQ